MGPARTRFTPERHGARLHLDRAEYTKAVAQPNSTAERLEDCGRGLLHVQVSKRFSKSFAQVMRVVPINTPRR